MNSTGVAIATSPCQPHHLHYLHVPGTPFLSPSLAPPQATSGASAIPHKATCIWLPACPLGALPPSFQPYLLITQKPGLHPHGFSKALSSPCHPCPKRQEPQVQHHLKAQQRLELSPRCAVLCLPTAVNCPGHRRNSASNVCASKTTPENQ